MADSSFRWKQQWDRFEHDGKDAAGNIQSHFLNYLLPPYTLKDIANNDIADCGCGSGALMKCLAPVARSITGFDIAISDNARHNAGQFRNIKLIEGDLASIKSKKRFDIVIADGILHHTSDPTATFNNLFKLLRPDGIMLVMVYSEEGNQLNKHIIYPISKHFFQKLSIDTLHRLAKGFVLILLVMERTVYRFGYKRLPFYDYLTGYFRHMSFHMNVLDIFDQMNAPLTRYLPRSTMVKWFNPKDFYNVTIRHSKGVTWAASGRKRGDC